jgi:hypothetical protein
MLFPGSADFFILRFSDESVEQGHQHDSHDKESERSENSCIIKSISHGLGFVMTDSRNGLAIIIRKNLHYNSQPYLILQLLQQRELLDFDWR